MQTALDSTAQEERSRAARPRRKRRLPISILVGGIAILGAVIYLVFANTQANAVYYMTVHELQTCTTCATQSVRVAGVVQKGSVVQSNGGEQVRFAIADSSDSQQLQVVYNGIVPDIFAPGITVVVEGHYTGKGPFQAQTLLAKCPSKFQSATPGATN